MNTKKNILLLVVFVGLQNNNHAKGVVKNYNDPILKILT